MPKHVEKECAAIVLKEPRKYMLLHMECPRRRKVACRDVVENPVDQLMIGNKHFKYFIICGICKVADLSSFEFWKSEMQQLHFVAASMQF